MLESLYRRRSLLLILPMSFIMFLLCSFYATVSVQAYTVTPHTQSSTIPTTWAMAAYNPQHTSFNPLETIINTQNASTLTLLWKNYTGARGSGSPVVANGRIYIASSNTLQAYNATTGKRIWTFTSPTFAGLDDTSPVVANNIVYIVANTDNYIDALDAATGKLIWSVRTIDGNYRSVVTPTVANGVFYVSMDYNQTLYAYNASTGKKLWTYSLPSGTSDFFSTAPTIFNNLVYIGDNYGFVHAINTTNGVQAWTFANHDGSNIETTPAVVKGVVYVSSGNTRLRGTPTIYAINATTGKLIWSVTNQVPVTDTTFIAATTTTLYLWSGDVYAFNVSTGAFLWKTQTGGAAGSPSAAPSVANGVVYAGSAEGNIFAFNASNGKQLWKYTTGAAVYSPLVIAKGILYASSNDTNLYAFHVKQ